MSCGARSFSRFTCFLRSRSRIDWAVSKQRRVRGGLVVALKVDGLRGGAGALLHHISHSNDSVRSSLPPRHTDAWQALPTERRTAALQQTLRVAQEACILA